MHSLHVNMVSCAGASWCCCNAVALQKRWSQRLHCCALADPRLLVPVCAFKALQSGNFVLQMGHGCFKLAFATEDIVDGRMQE